MIGRRVDSVEAIEQPGDYWYDPDGLMTAGKPAVFFRLPIEPTEPGDRSLHHVVSPPHVFRECSDGSIEVRESIGAYGFNGRSEGHRWHGYLDEGHIWRTC